MDDSFSCLELLLRYLSEVSKSAPKLPLYYYHNPGHTGLSCKKDFEYFV